MRYWSQPRKAAALISAWLKSTWHMQGAVRQISGSAPSSAKFEQVLLESLSVHWKLGGRKRCRLCRDPVSSSFSNSADGSLSHVRDMVLACAEGCEGVRSSEHLRMPAAGGIGS